MQDNNPDIERKIPCEEGDKGGIDVVLLPSWKERCVYALRLVRLEMYMRDGEIVEIFEYFFAILYEHLVRV
jgi:hypothetical protein